MSCCMAVRVPQHACVVSLMGGRDERRVREACDAPLSICMAITDARDVWHANENAAEWRARGEQGAVSRSQKWSAKRGVEKRRALDSCPPPPITRARQSLLATTELTDTVGRCHLPNWRQARANRVCMACVPPAKVIVFL